ncbi:hypothetical protein H0H93_006637 [Arthromyces matolae]|nr:hypothetical protein H0H93_006637 [Arthromyces matolae]
MDDAYIDLYIKIQHATSRIMRIPQEELLKFGFKRPHAFLRHVLFAVCGIKGHLFIDGVDSQPVQVDYDSVDIREKYIYISDPGNEPAFIDIDGLNSEVTTSALTPRRLKFHKGVVKRDGVCLITGDPEEVCQAAHIIAHSKGDEYISRVAELRSDPYPDEVHPNEINSVENALLLRGDFHRAFGFGLVAVITVPNFSMTCEDIPYVPGPPPILPPAKRMSIVEIVKTSGDRFPSPIRTGCDLIFTGKQNQDIPPPSTMLLDFHLGLSFYQRWGVLDSKDLLRTYHRDHYENIPVVYSALQAPDNDPNDSTPYEDDRKAMERAMDDLLCFNMMLRGYTPEVMKEMAQRRQEEEQRRQEEEQLQSRQKVMEWMETSESGAAGSPFEHTQ